jgi:excisionase family DNA binding protein
MELVVEKLNEFRRLMTVEELAQLLRVSEDTIRRYWRRNIIPSTCGRKFGDILRFDPQEIKHWLIESGFPAGFNQNLAPVTLTAPLREDEEAEQ